MAGLLWSVGALAQNRPKFMSDDPLQREPDTQDASKVQEWDIGLLADLTMNLFTRPGDPGGERSRRQHQYDRRGSRLELVHEPDLRARRHDRRDHQGTQHVGRSGQGQVDRHPSEVSRRVAGVHDPRREGRSVVHLVRCARQSSGGDGGRRRSRRGCSGLSATSRSRATSRRSGRRTSSSAIRRRSARTANAGRCGPGTQRRLPAVRSGATTVRIAWSPAGRSPAGPSAGSSTSARVPTIQTTSCRTSIDASSAP